jgi:hypothetical protein
MFEEGDQRRDQALLNRRKGGVDMRRRLYLWLPVVAAIAAALANAADWGP